MSSTERPGRPGSTAALRRFGVVMAAAWTALGLLLWWRSSAAAPYLLGLAVLFVLAAAISPRTLASVERTWMRLAGVLSVVMTTMILTLTFYLVVTPLGVLRRLVGKDTLGLRFDPGKASYWVPVEPDGPGSRSDRPY